MVDSPGPFCYNNYMDSSKVDRLTGSYNIEESKMATNTIKRDVVTIMIQPTDKRKSPACYDLNTPVLLGRFLQDNNFDPETGTIGPRSAPHGTLGFVRGLDIDWVQEVLAQLEDGHDFWTRSTRVV